MEEKNKKCCQTCMHRMWNPIGQKWFCGFSIKHAPDNPFMKRVLSSDSCTYWESRMPENRHYLETARLKLRKVYPCDAKKMFENWACDPEVTRYLHWDVHKSVIETEKIIAEWEERRQREKFYCFGICLKETDELIGTLELREEEPGVGTVGYVLGKKWWNQGIMTEALNTVIDWVIYFGLFDEIRACCWVKNIASDRVMQKAGMVYDGPDDSEYQGVKEEKIWRKIMLCDTKDIKKASG